MSISLRPNLSNKEHLKTKYLRNLIDSNISNLLSSGDTDVSKRKVQETKVKKVNKTIQEKYVYIDNFINNYFKFITYVNNTDDGYITDECTSEDDDYFDDYLSN